MDYDPSKELTAPKKKSPVKTDSDFGEVHFGVLDKSG